MAPAAAPPQPEAARRLAAAFGGLLVLTEGLIVLGALVRAHGAGLACPDWPLCFGEVIPTFDLRVAFEWSHRTVAGMVAVVFAGLAWATWRRASTRRDTRGLLIVAAVLLALQILLGALTVWQLLAAWTVTSHLVTGNAFACALLLTALSLLGESRGDAAPRAEHPGVRAAFVVCAGLLLLQLVLGGLVSSRYAGLACPDWPTCSGGIWFPTWDGVVGLHLLHRMNGYALVLALVLTAGACRSSAALRWPTLAAAGVATLQALVGILNVRLGIPVEMTGLHSALAAALVLLVAVGARRAWISPG